MKLTDLAFSAATARTGVKFYYDTEKTCGAVLRGFGTEYQAARSKYDVEYELQVQAAKAAGNHAELTRIENEIVGKAMAEYIVVSIFDEDGVITDRDKIEYVLNNEDFKQFRTWCLTKANDPDAFPLSEKEVLEIAGKLRPVTGDGGKSKPKV